MENLLLYAYIMLSITVVWLILHYWYKIQSRDFIQSFIDSQENMMILSTESKVTMMNQEALRFLAFDSLKDFHLSKKNLVDFFEQIEECDECLHKYSFGQKWISNVYKKTKKNHKIVNKVKIFSQVDGLEYYFQIRASKRKGSNEYILNFTDISQIERSRMFLEKSAEVDPLTKIYNRVRMNKLFESLLLNANKHDTKLSIILFDIDHFKSINDQYGHNIGDSVLVELATLVKGILRENDVIARWGGEEFLIVLHDTSLEDARKLAERIRLAITNFYFSEVKHVSCSFGVTQFKSADTHISFIERADEALYEAKDTGRNKVVIRKQEA